MAQINEIKNAVIYCRVSTEEQVKGESLDGQNRLCCQFAERNGFSVIRKFIEQGQSATTALRTELQKMMSFCFDKRNHVSAVICLKQDRFCRNVYDEQKLEKALKAVGIKMLYVYGINDESATAQLQRNINSSFAQFESQLNSERTKAGNTQAFLSGRWIKALRGYSFETRPVGGQIKRVIVPNGDAKHIIKAFEMMAKGVYNQRDVARELEKDGFRVSPQSLNKILNNPVYCGLLPDSHNVNEGVSVKGIHEPIIPEKIYNTVQDIMHGKKPTITPRLKNNPDFPLRGYILCPKCGRKLTASKHKGEHGNYGYYYWCQKGCKVSYRKKDLEPQYLAHLQSIAPREETLKLLEIMFVDKLAERTQVQAEQQRKIQARIEQLNKEKGVLVRTLANRPYMEEDILPEVESIKKEIAKQEAMMGQKIGEIDIKACWRYAKFFITNMAGAWQDSELDIRQRIQGLITPEGFTFDGNLIKPKKNPYFVGIFNPQNRDFKHQGG